MIRGAKFAGKGRETRVRDERRESPKGTLPERRWLLALMLAMLVSSLSVAAQQEPSSSATRPATTPAAEETSAAKELPNFHQVNEHLYRGAQPGVEGFERLARLGIRTVINLRDDDERATVEEAAAERMGLRYYNIPFGGFGRPSEAKVEEVLSLIEAKENWPVFVHCKRGADRTGVVIAAYRIAHDGWNAETATHEAKHYGLSWTQFKMKDFISDFYRRRQACAGGESGSAPCAAAATH